MPKTHVMMFDEAELIVRMIEAYVEVPRPEGVTPEDALSWLDGPERDGWLRVAQAVRGYVTEIVGTAQRIQ